MSHDLAVLSTTTGQVVLATSGTSKDGSLRRHERATVVGYTSHSLGPSHLVLLAEVRYADGTVVATNRLRRGW